MSLLASPRGTDVVMAQAGRSRDGGEPLRDPRPATGTTPSATHRPRVGGKFLFVGDDKLYVRGVTYGAFAPDAHGVDYPERSQVALDFAAMAASGMNAVRTYTVPPGWLLDVAAEHRLWVMVGLAWEQHVAFLDDRRRARDIERRVRAGVAALAGHPALLAVAVGNEVPAPIVRWLGRARVERFIERLHRGAKAEDPGALVTYVNYPTTEYLQLPFLDFLAFNVYLESREPLQAYLARLQSLAGDRPLVMAEIGLDSRRNGEDGQASSIAWQVRSAFAAGAAGTFVFGWTDEWHRGGHEIRDWDFGLTTRGRAPKRALAAVRTAYANVPFARDRAWPRISVVVCSYNGARTIRDCLEGLARLDYPNVEVIVVDDGSTDATSAIAAEYDVRLISTPNRGLSAARNTGLQAATGEIVAYTDDDARPDPHWLQYLAATFEEGGYAAAGGPNIAPPGDGWIADCVANAPGGPVHVLLTDGIAEHVPGCNMAFRRERLAAIGGFDPIYRAAGDDVDACWRIQDAGGVIGFSPAAMVWHHRRNSIRAYWRQQQGYGRAEALLERKWPERYNSLGHLSWAGQLYGKGLTATLRAPGGRLYGGTWGTAAFQSLYEPGPGWASLALMPEWYLLIAALAGLTLLGLAWPPLLLAAAPLAVAVAAPLLQAWISAARASFTSQPHGWREQLRLRSVTFLFHLVQPLARLWGRIRNGLSIWRVRAGTSLGLPWPRRSTIWSEHWVAHEARLAAIESWLKARGGAVLRGGDFDRWDLELRTGILGSARLLSATEEHGGEKQLVRFRVWPRVSGLGALLTMVVGGLAVAAAASGSPFAAGVLGAVAAALLLRLLVEASLATGSMRAALSVPDPGQSSSR
jgi:GT2 family glycosyltransferase